MRRQTVVQARRWDLSRSLLVVHLRSALQRPTRTYTAPCLVSLHLPPLHPPAVRDMHHRTRMHLGRHWNRPDHNMHLKAARLWSPMEGCAPFQTHTFHRLPCQARTPRRNLTLAHRVCSRNSSNRSRIPLSERSTTPSNSLLEARTNPRLLQRNQRHRLEDTNHRPISTTRPQPLRNHLAATNRLQARTTLPLTLTNRRPTSHTSQMMTRITNHP